MMYYMLGYALGILWGIIGSIYVVVNVIAIFATLIEESELPSFTRVLKVLGAVTATTVVWWAVWALSFYI